MNLVRLGDAVDFLDSRRRPVKAVDRNPGPYPYYGANGMQGTIDGFLFDEPLILLAEDGGHFFEPHRGIAYKISGKTWVNNHAHVLRPKKDFDIDFLKYALRNLDVSSYLTGSTRAKLTKAGASEIKFLAPDLKEQKRIAAILDAADALRAKRRESIEQLDKLAHSVFLDMFGDPRVPESRGTKKTISVKMGELTKIRTGKLDANAADEDGEFPFFTCAVQPLKINTPAFDTKAVLVAGNGDLNVKYYEGRFNAYQRTYVIEPKDESVLNPRFLYLFLDLYVSELRKKSIGGVIKYIKLPYLTDALVQLPEIKVQEEFSEIVQSIETQKKKLGNHLGELDALFASLQSQAFSGNL